jgi:hypothetical protein
VFSPLPVHPHTAGLISFNELIRYKDFQFINNSAAYRKSPRVTSGLHSGASGNGSGSVTASPIGASLTASEAAVALAGDSANNSVPELAAEQILEMRRLFDSYDADGTGEVGQAPSRLCLRGVVGLRVCIATRGYCVVGNCAPHNNFRCRRRCEYTLSAFWGHNA